MPENYTRAIERAISEERLSNYGQSNDSDELDKVSRYVWNMSLCESLYPMLQGLEVALRNSVHSALSLHLGSDSWFDLQSNPILFDAEKKRVDEAKRRLSKARKPHDPGKIVAELNFGFWNSLFDKRYESSSNPLWPLLISSCFPNAPRAVLNRKSVLRRLEEIRKLRNRVFHHEPIWHWSDLEQKHSKLVDAVGWISPELQKTLIQIDGFKRTYSAGVQGFRAHVESVAHRR